MSGNGAQPLEGNGGTALREAYENTQGQLAEARYQALVERIPGIVYSAARGAGGQWLYVSPQVESILGYGPEEWLSHPNLWFERLYPPDRERARADEERSSTSMQPLDSEYRMIARDGRVIWFHDKGALVYDEVHQAVLFEGVMLDVTDRREVEAEWRAGQEQLVAAQRLNSAVIDSALDCMITIDAQGYVREFNPAAEATFGYSRDQAIGVELADLIVPPSLRERHRQGFKRVIESGKSTILDRRLELSGMRSDGTEFPLEIAITRVSADPPMFTGFLRDITERKDGERNLRESHDQLQSIIDNSPSVIWAKDRSLRYLFANRQFGRVYGMASDAVLGRTDEEVMSPEIAARARHTDSKVLDQGELVEEEEVVRRGAEGRTYLTHKFPLRDDADEIYGVCAVSTDITERRRQEDELREELEWSTRIRDAVGRDRLVLHAQPILDLETGQVAHEELLVRMKGEGGVLVPPAEFLPAAERFGLMGEIDRWVVGNAILLAKERSVDVNLSAQSIGDGDLIRFIVSELSRHQVEPNNVIFEITETAAAEDLERASSFAQRLREIGCGVALDDFGTGFGSFNYLKHLPVTHLKIDQEFVKDLASSEPGQRVVTSIVQVAQNFGMRTVGEGVEDERSLGLLLELGVDYAQGYFVGRPAPLS
jgi:PAS domain S-box-containing protein